jgi:hypothetical protein
LFNARDDGGFMLVFYRISVEKKSYTLVMR